MRKEDGDDVLKRGCIRRGPCRYERIHSEITPARKNKASESPEGKVDAKVSKSVGDVDAADS